MATQADTFDPRAEALAASRYRSGSFKMDGVEVVHPPATGPEPGASSAVTAAPGKATASQFRNLRTKFEEKDAAAAGQAGRSTSSSLFGSSVSRMKQKFQAGDRAGEAALGPPPRGRGNDRSPENKRKKVSEGQGSALAPALDLKRRSASVESAQSAQHHHPGCTSPPLSPTHSHHVVGGNSKPKQGLVGVGNQKAADQGPEPAGLSEPTNHVQRFNYTMALFARMEEETRRAQERDKVARRKISPSRLSITPGGTPSPLLSPSAQENQPFPSPNTDSLQRARRSKSIPQESASELTSSRPLSDSMTQAVILPEPAEDGRIRSQSGPDGADVYADARSQENSYNTSFQKDAGKDSINVSTDFSRSKVPARPSSGASSNSDKGRIVQDAPNVAEDPELRPTSVLPHSSRLEHSMRPSARAQYQQAKSANSSGLSSSAPSSASSSPHSRSQDTGLPARHSSQSVSSSSLPSVSASVSGAEVVTLRANRASKTDSSSNGQSETAKKRLSREEIESALERADTYLANLEAVPDPPPVKKTEYHRTDGIHHGGCSEALLVRRYAVIAIPTVVFYLLPQQEEECRARGAAEGGARLLRYHGRPQGGDATSSRAELNA